MKIDCTKYTETHCGKRVDRTLNYFSTNSTQATNMAQQFQIFLGEGWTVHISSRNPYGHGWGCLQFTVYAVKM
jgi:hypothetical protein